MHREINPPEEILRRLTYLIYLALLVGTVVVAILALVQSRNDYLLISAVLCLLSLQLKRYGRRRLNFDRLARTFPTGTHEDDISPALRQEIEGMIREWTDLDWVQRQEIRTRLAALIEKDVRLFEIFREEIFSIHPNLAAKTELLLHEG